MNRGDQANQVLMEMMNEMQMADTITVFNKLVQRSFEKCILDFRTNVLSKAERKCVSITAEKYLRYSQRTSLRFAEHQQRTAVKQRQEQEELARKQAEAAAVTAGDSKVVGSAAVKAAVARAAASTAAGGAGGAGAGAAAGAAAATAAAVATEATSSEALDKE